MAARSWKPIAGLLGLLSLFLTMVAHSADSQSDKQKEDRARDAKHETSGKKGGDEYALLVGVSDYRFQAAKEWRNLHGAEDAEAMRQALRTRGFPDSHICVLKNEQATRLAIEQAFRDCLVKPARKGATLVFYFSGHGGRMLDDNGDETDGLDEALIPYDWDATPNGKNYLRDDRLAELLGEARRAMQDSTDATRGDIVVFLDSCFSGTATRGANQTAIYRGQAELPVGILRPASLHARPKGLSGLFSQDPGNAHVVVMSAAQADESALEMPLTDGSPPQGVFTSALTEALKARSGPRTYRALFETVRFFVTQRAPNQHPQMEGNPEVTSRALFAHETLHEGYYVPIEKVDANRGLISLPVGLVHGATLGSRYALFPAAKELALIRECNPQHGCLATVTLNHVGAATSTAPVPSGVPVARLVAGRAVEIAHNQPETAPVRVFLVPGTPVPANLFSSQPDSVVVLGSEAEHDVRVEQQGQVLWAMRRGAALPKKLDKEKYLSSQTTSSDVLFRRELTPLSNRTGSSAYSGAMGDLTQALRAYWTYRHLSNLRGTNPSLAVSLRLVRVAKSNAPRVSPDGVEFDLNEEVDIELQNEGARGVHATLLELTPDGDINVLYPSAQRQTGVTINFLPASREWKRLDVRVRLNPPGRSLWKLVITEQPADFASVAHQRVLKGQSPLTALANLPPQMQPLGKLLLSAALHTRSQPIQTAPDSWMTRDYLVWVLGPGRTIDSGADQAAP